jgi:hypothetical protein
LSATVGEELEGTKCETRFCSRDFAVEVMMVGCEGPVQIYRYNTAGFRTDCAVQLLELRSQVTIRCRIVKRWKNTAR